jgi:hypothetical protein
MSDVVRFTDPKEAAREAVSWSLIQSAAEEYAKAARAWMVEYLTGEDSRGLDAYAADGTLIGSVTRSKPKELVDVLDADLFMGYVVEHRPDLLTVEYQARMSLLRSFKQVGDMFIDPNGVPVPGVGKRMTHGSVRVNKEASAKALVRDLLAGAAERLQELEESAHVAIKGEK